MNRPYRNLQPTRRHFCLPSVPLPYHPKTVTPLPSAIPNKPPYFYITRRPFCRLAGKSCPYILVLVVLKYPDSKGLVRTNCPKIIIPQFLSPAEVGEDYGSTSFRRWIPREGNCTNFFSLLFVSYITPVTIVLIPHNSVLYFLQVMILIDS